MRERLVREIIKLRAVRLLSLQLMMVMIVSLCWIFHSGRDAYSAFMGGLAYWLPSVLFAVLFFAKSHKRQASQIITFFYLGEIIKLFLSVSLMLLCFNKLNTAIWPMFSGFLAAYFGNWLEPLFMIKKRVESQ